MISKEILEIILIKGMKHINTPTILMNEKIYLGKRYLISVNYESI